MNAYKTKSGKLRYVLRDGDGNEYTTFRKEIARSALAAEGKRARIKQVPRAAASRRTEARDLRVGRDPLRTLER